MNNIANNSERNNSESFSLKLYWLTFSITQIFLVSKTFRMVQMKSAPKTEIERKALNVSAREIAATNEIRTAAKTFTKKIIFSIIQNFKVNKMCFNRESNTLEIFCKIFARIKRKMKNEWRKEKAIIKRFHFVFQNLLSNYFSFPQTYKRKFIMDYFVSCNSI